MKISSPEINRVSFDAEEEPSCYGGLRTRVAVSAGTAGQAAEVLALIGELIAAEPPVFAAIGRFMDTKGADQLPATGWLMDSISDLASQLGGTLETAGIERGPRLPRFRRPDRTR